MKNFALFVTFAVLIAGCSTYKTQESQNSGVKTSSVNEASGTLKFKTPRGAECLLGNLGGNIIPGGPKVIFAGQQVTDSERTLEVDLPSGHFSIDIATGDVAKTYFVSASLKEFVIDPSTGKKVLGKSIFTMSKEPPGGDDGDFAVAEASRIIQNRSVYWTFGGAGVSCHIR